MSQVGGVWPAPGDAVTVCRPACSVRTRLELVNAPESTLYFRVAFGVVMTNQPSFSSPVEVVDPKASRPMALKVGASVNDPSVEYSVRISVEDRTSNRA